MFRERSLNVNADFTGFMRCLDCRWKWRGAHQMVPSRDNLRSTKPSQRVLGRQRRQTPAHRQCLRGDLEARLFRRQSAPCSSLAAVGLWSVIRSFLKQCSPGRWLRDDEMGGASRSVPVQVIGAS